MYLTSVILCFPGPVESHPERGFLSPCQNYITMVHLRGEKRVFTCKITNALLRHPIVFSSNHISVKIIVLYCKTREYSQGVPVVAQRLMNLTNIHEDAG